MLFVANFMLIEKFLLFWISSIFIFIIDGLRTRRLLFYLFVGRLWSVWLHLGLPGPFLGSFLDHLVLIPLFPCELVQLVNTFILLFLFVLPISSVIDLALSMFLHLHFLPEQLLLPSGKLPFLSFSFLTKLSNLHHSFTLLLLLIKTIGFLLFLLSFNPLLSFLNCSSLLSLFYLCLLLTA